jgi:predicted nucleic acid-binding protein
VNYLRSLSEPLLVPAIVLGELYVGVRDGQERRKLDDFAAGNVILPLTAAIAVAGGLYRRQYGKSHSSGFNDCMTAATVDAYQGRLITLNQKHFPMLANVIIPYQKA